MSDAGRVIAIIPLRGGSKGIPRKNINKFAGYPLCAWSITACLATPGVDEVWVSTEDEEIASIASKWGARIHPRSSESASDTASTESVLADFAARCEAWKRARAVVLVQATSPLIDPAFVAEGVQLVTSGAADSVVSVSRQHVFVWTSAPAAEGSDSGTGSDTREVAWSANYDPVRRPRRQDWPGILTENGAFYVFTPAGFDASNSRLHGRVRPVEMPEEHRLELDSMTDWHALESIARANRRCPMSLRPAVDAIRVFAFDVDGTLTPGHRIIHPDRADCSLMFDVRDGKGFDLAKARGFRIFVLTSSAGPAYVTRFAQFPTITLVQSCEDKVAALSGLLREGGFTWDQVAYMGDDVNDLGCMRKAAIAACPRDAVTAVRQVCAFHCERKAGNAAVRELIDWVLGMQESRV